MTRAPMPRKADLKPEPEPKFTVRISGKWFMVDVADGPHAMVARTSWEAATSAAPGYLKANYKWSALHGRWVPK